LDPIDEDRLRRRKERVLATEAAARAAANAAAALAEAAASACSGSSIKEQREQLLMENNMMIMGGEQYRRGAGRDKGGSRGRSRERGRDDSLVPTSESSVLAGYSLLVDHNTANSYEHILLKGQTANTSASANASASGSALAAASDRYLATTSSTSDAAAVVRRSNTTSNILNFSHSRHRYYVVGGKHTPVPLDGRINSNNHSINSSSGNSRDSDMPTADVAEGGRGMIGGDNSYYASGGSVKKSSTVRVLGSSGKPAKGDEQREAPKPSQSPYDIPIGSGHRSSSGSTNIHTPTRIKGGGGGGGGGGSGLSSLHMLSTPPSPAAAATAPSTSATTMHTSLPLLIPHIPYIPHIPSFSSYHTSRLHGDRRVAPIDSPIDELDYDYYKAVGDNRDNTERQLPAGHRDTGHGPHGLGKEHYDYNHHNSSKVNLPPSPPPGPYGRPVDQSSQSQSRPVGQIGMMDMNRSAPTSSAAVLSHNRSRSRGDTVAVAVAVTMTSPPPVIPFTPAISNTTAGTAVEASGTRTAGLDDRLAGQNQSRSRTGSIGHWRDFISSSLH
jgi:hypothetical protein